MIRKTRLFTPGPTPLLPAAQFAMAAADIHHRTAEFRALYTRVLAQLKEFVGTQNDVILLSSSGTGAMEASVSNLTSPGDRVLVLTAGKFGERWSALAKNFGCAVDVVEAPYGKTFSIEAIGTSPTAIYVQSASLNGKQLHRAWLSHAELIAGGQLTLHMGEHPQAWDTEPPPGGVDAWKLAD